MPISNRHFGVELEVIGNNLNLSPAHVARYLCDRGVECQSEGYNHNTQSYWRIVPDNSLSPGGMELVSPILSGERGIEQVKNIARHLVALGIKVDRSCGLHVHVSAENLNAADIVSVVKRYIKFEKDIDSFMPLSRRENNNHYCQSPNLIQRLRRMDLGATSSPRNTRIISNNMQNAEDRYYKINLHSFVRHGTIEFRQHSGSINGEKIENWIRFCVGFVEASKLVIRPNPVYAEMIRAAQSINFSTRTVDRIIGTNVGATSFTRIPDGAPSEVVTPVPATSPVAPQSLSPNAMIKKYAVIAKMIDDLGNTREYIPAIYFAERLGCSVNQVPSYIAKFRAKYNVDIRNRRGIGYFVMGFMNLCDKVSASPDGALAVQMLYEQERAENGTNTPIPEYVVTQIEDDVWHRGLPDNVREFYIARTQELAQT